MAKLLKSILGNVKKLEGVKSSSKEKLDLGGYNPESPDALKFVKKHEVEKFADRAGNGENAYKATTKEAPYQKQNPSVYEDNMSDTEGLQQGAQASPPASPSTAKKFRKKSTVNETVVHVLETLSTHGVPMKFKNGDTQLVAPEAAMALKSIFESLTDENKKKFIDVAFNSFEDFNELAKLKG